MGYQDDSRSFKGDTHLRSTPSITPFNKDSSIDEIFTAGENFMKPSHKCNKVYLIKRRYLIYLLQGGPGGEWGAFK